MFGTLWIGFTGQETEFLILSDAKYSLSTGRPRASTFTALLVKLHINHATILQSINNRFIFQKILLRKDLTAYFLSQKDLLLLLIKQIKMEGKHTIT